MKYELKLYNQDYSELWVLPYETINIDEKLNSGVSAQVTLNYLALKRYAEILSTTPDAIISSAYREWKLFRNSATDPLFAGILVHRKIQGGGGQPTSFLINMADYSAIFNKRRTAEETIYSAEDSADIAWGEINASQGDVSGFGDAGIVRGTHPTTKNRDRTCRFDNIRDLIVGMSNAKVADGYDFEFDITKTFNIYYPTKGQVRENIVLDGHNIISWTNDRDLAGNLTNRVHVLGKGTGADRPSATREDTTPMATWGLCEDILTESGVETVSELEDRGDSYLDTEKQPVDVVSVTVRDSAPEISSYSVGDTVRVKIDELQYNELKRIVQRSIQIQRTGEALVSLSFEQK